MKLTIINLLAGLFLLVVTLIEVFEQRASIELEIEHGLLVYAIAHLVNRAVEFYEAYEKVRRHRSELKQAH
jgi:hypothetical protein